MTRTSTNQSAEAAASEELLAFVATFSFSYWVLIALESFVIELDPAEAHLEVGVKTFSANCLDGSRLLARLNGPYSTCMSARLSKLLSAPQEDLAECANASNEFLAPLNAMVGDVVNVMAGVGGGPPWETVLQMSRVSLRMRRLALTAYMTCILEELVEEEQYGLDEWADRVGEVLDAALASMYMFRLVPENLRDDVGTVLLAIERVMANDEYTHCSFSTKLILGTAEVAARAASCVLRPS